MSGSFSKYSPRTPEAFAGDFDLDLDAPIGASFAAALRGGDREPGPALAAAEAGAAADAATAAVAGGEARERDGAPRSETVAALLQRFDETFHGANEPEDAAIADADVGLDADLAGDGEAPPADPHADAEPDFAAEARAAEEVQDDFAASFGVEDAPSARAGAPGFGRGGDARSAFDDGEDLPPLADALAADADAAAADGAEPAEADEGVVQAFDYGLLAPEGGDRVLPRIAVHAFCVRTQLLATLRAIGRDRRMRNVTMEVFEGGVQAAIDHYVNETTPNLVILEGSSEPQRLLAELDALAQHCDENIRVVVIGSTNDIRLYRELMRRGVSEYLVAPVAPVQMIRAISALFTDPDAPFTGKSLAVTGVKGGVGSSALAHNLAWSLAERFKAHATLVDLDLNFGTTGLDFNEEAPQTIADALMAPDRFDEAIMNRLVTKATDRLSLFTAPATLDRTYDLDAETYTRVLEQVRASVPFVVLDLPHIWTDWFKSTIIAADEIVVVAAPELASLRNGKNLIDFLKAARPNDQPPRLVLNMVGVPKRPEIPVKDFSQAIGLEPTLVLPFDPHLFGTAANNGQMIFDVAPQSKCVEGIDRLARLLSGRDAQIRKPSILKKLMGR